MLTDKKKIRVFAGKGGEGIVAFSKEKMRLGPTGGDGGKGGDILAEGIPDIGALRQFRYKRDFYADNGKRGEGKCSTGASGKDIILKIPIGTIVRDLETGREDEIIKVGDRVVMVRGGNGGRGNFSFRSSTKTTPEKATEGLDGEKKEIEFELKLIADVGLVGLPNVGKSSLLNEITKAKSRVANYQFTTLEPHLGVYENLILADIPGLISGASLGKGLGTRFLRHIERTRVIFHLISCESDDLNRDYEIIRKEMTLYGKGVETKQEHIIFTKTDLLEEGEVKKILKKFPDSIGISIYDDKSIEKVKILLGKLVF